METNTYINAQNVNKQFSRGADAIYVLNQLDLEIESGDFIALRYRNTKRFTAN